MSSRQLARIGRNLMPSLGRRGLFDFDREMMNVMRPFEGFFGDSLSSRRGAGGMIGSDTSFVPSVDVKETDKAYEIVAEMPGLKRENVDIELDEESRTVTLRGETKAEKEEKEENFLYRERSLGKFMRSFQVPDNAKLEDIRAVMRDGLLKLEIPKGEEREYQPKKIDIITDDTSQQEGGNTK